MSKYLLVGTIVLMAGSNDIFVGQNDQKEGEYACMNHALEGYA